MGDPQLLFLDEPTTGLDPGSRRQLWDVISRFGEVGRTVLLTTHYMDEAERLCDRVAIIHLGKIIAIGTPRELIAGLGGEHIVEFSLQDCASEQKDGTNVSADEWLNLPTVHGSTFENGCHRLSVAEPHVVVPALLQKLEQSELELTSLTTRHASLEDVFVELTGRHLDDDGEAESHD